MGPERGKKREVGVRGKWLTREKKLIEERKQKANKNSNTAKGNGCSDKSVKFAREPELWSVRGGVCVWGEMRGVGFT